MYSYKFIAFKEKLKKLPAISKDSEFYSTSSLYVLKLLYFGTVDAVCFSENELPAEGNWKELFDKSTDFKNSFWFFRSDKNNDELLLLIESINSISEETKQKLRHAIWINQELAISVMLFTERQDGVYFKHDLSLPYITDLFEQLENKYNISIPITTKQTLIQLVSSFKEVPEEDRNLGFLLSLSDAYQGDREHAVYGYKNSFSEDYLIHQFFNDMPFKDYKPLLDQYFERDTRISAHPYYFLKPEIFDRSYQNVPPVLEPFQAILETVYERLDSAQLHFKSGIGLSDIQSLKPKMPDKMYEAIYQHFIRHQKFLEIFFRSPVSGSLDKLSPSYIIDFSESKESIDMAVNVNIYLDNYLASQQTISEINNLSITDLPDFISCYTFFDHHHPLDHPEQKEDRVAQHQGHYFSQADMTIIHDTQESLPVLFSKRGLMLVDPNPVWQSQEDEQLKCYRQMVLCQTYRREVDLAAQELNYLPALKNELSVEEKKDRTAWLKIRQIFVNALLEKELPDKNKILSDLKKLSDKKDLREFKKYITSDFIEEILKKILPRREFYGIKSLNHPQGPLLSQFISRERLLKLDKSLSILRWSVEDAAKYLLLTGLDGYHRLKQFYGKPVFPKEALDLLYKLRDPKRTPNLNKARETYNQLVDLLSSLKG